MDPNMDMKHRQTNVDIMVSLDIFENNSHYRNLINQITSLYIREIMDEIRDLENLRVNIKRRVALLLLISMVLLRVLVLKMDYDMDLKCRQTNVNIVVSLNISENNSHHRKPINIDITIHIVEIQY
jgi:hypothetical protein